MDIERAAKQVQSATGLIGIVGGLLAAIAAFNKQLREAVDIFAPLGFGGLVGLAAVLLVVGLAMFARGRRQGSRLIDPDALRLDPRNPEHLIGRGEDVRLLRQKCEARPLVFLVGNSGSGKSALVQAGLVPAAVTEGRLLPIYLDMADLDWETGPLASLADRFWRALIRLRHGWACRLRDGGHEPEEYRLLRGKGFSSKRRSHFPAWRRMARVEPSIVGRRSSPSERRRATLPPLSPRSG